MLPSGELEEEDGQEVAAADGSTAELESRPEVDEEDVGRNEGGTAWTIDGWTGRGGNGHEDDGGGSGRVGGRGGGGGGVTKYDIRGCPWVLCFDIAQDVHRCVSDSEYGPDGVGEGECVAGRVFVEAFSDRGGSLVGIYGDHRAPRDGNLHEI